MGWQASPPDRRVHFQGRTVRVRAAGPFQTARNEKQEKLDKAIDQIRKKYGEDSVRRARFLDGEMNHMAGGLNKEKSRYRQRREE